MVYTCKNCQKEFESKPSNARKFCSAQCYRQTPISEETRNKMSEARLKNPVKYWGGKKQTKAMCESKSEKLKGNKHTQGKSWKLTENTRRAISKALKKAHAEYRHPNYKGGVTDKNMLIRKSVDIKLWREAVFQRDDFTCQECLVRGGKLNADHIKPFSIYEELRFNVDNGRTLCVECHRKTDTYGWSSMHMKKQLTEYYS